MNIITRQKEPNLIKRVYQWNDERGLIKGYNPLLECSFIAEELSELMRTSDEVEIIDALIDITLFSMGGYCKLTGDAKKSLTHFLYEDDTLIEDLTIKGHIDTVFDTLDILDECHAVAINQQAFLEAFNQTNTASIMLEHTHYLLEYQSEKDEQLNYHKHIILEALLARTVAEIKPSSKRRYKSEMSEVKPPLIKRYNRTLRLNP